MTLEGAVALLFATALFALIPGPGVAALIAQALARGFAPAAMWAVGLVLGDLFYLVLAMFGMGWVAQQLGDGFLVLKWLGAAYLVYLGIRAWLAKPPVLGQAAEQSALSGRRSLLGGLCVSLGNPKVIAFYCGFLPGFVDMQALSASDMLLVAAIIVPTVLSVLLTYAGIAARGRNAMGSTRLWKLANRGAGTVMIGAGAVIIAE